MTAPARDGRSSLELLGFDAASALFSLRLRHQTGHVDASPSSFRVLRRDWSSWRAWDRALRKSSAKLPVRKLRRLMERSWVKGDESSGWRLEMVKSVVECEAWVNAALDQLPEAARSEFLDDDMHLKAQKRRRDEREAVKNARDLQQFFTSPALVDVLVETVCERLRESQIPMESVVFLEPSFGDGRVARALVDSGARSVIGYEIDEDLHREAEGSCDLQCRLLCGDFLASKWADVCDMETINEKVVIAVGNPPFGDKKENASEPGHAPDLVLRFMAHAAAEWRAELLAFIVPERCSKSSFVTAALAALSDAAPHFQWELEQCKSLDDCTFELGAKRVKQPSVLQLFASRSA